MQTIKELIRKRLRQTLTPAEEQALEAWMTESDENRAIVQELSDPQRLAQSFAKLDRLHPELVWERVKSFSADHTGNDVYRMIQPCACSSSVM